MKKVHATRLHGREGGRRKERLLGGDGALDLRAGQKDPRLLHGPRPLPIRHPGGGYRRSAHPHSREPLRRRAGPRRRGGEVLRRLQKPISRIIRDVSVRGPPPGLRGPPRRRGADFHGPALRRLHGRRLRGRGH